MDTYEFDRLKDQETKLKSENIELRKLVKELRSSAPGDIANAEIDRLKKLGSQFWQQSQDLMSQVYDLADKLNKANSRIYELENMKYPINLN